MAKTTRPVAALLAAIVAAAVGCAHDEPTINQAPAVIYEQTDWGSVANRALDIASRVATALGPMSYDFSDEHDAIRISEDRTNRRGYIMAFGPVCKVVWRSQLTCNQTGEIVSIDVDSTEFIPFKQIMDNLTYWSLDFRMPVAPPAMGPVPDLASR